MRRILVTGVLATVMCGHPRPAAAECAQDYVELMRSYDLLVLGYRLGDTSTIDTWLKYDDRTVTRAIAGIDSPCDPIKPSSLERYKAAVMLASDAAQRLTARGAVAQYRYVSLLLRQGGPPLQAFARQWYLVTAHHLRAKALLWDADTVLASARRLLPADPDILYQSGVTAEYLVIINTNALEHFQRTPPPMAGNLRAKQREQEDLSRKTVREQAEHAELWLTQAAKAGSDSAALHLARIHLTLGKTMNAVAEADEVFDRTTDNNLAYIAALLGGAAREATAALNGAEERYRLAIARNPSAEFGYVALSQVLMRQGRYDDARTALAPALAPPTEERQVRDPWWFFSTDIGYDEGDPFVALREEARR